MFNTKIDLLASLNAHFLCFVGKWRLQYCWGVLGAEDPGPLIQKKKKKKKKKKPHKTPTKNIKKKKKDLKKRKRK